MVFITGSSFITRNKDVDALIMEKLEDDDLINFCRACNYQGICANEEFWRKRFLSKYGILGMKNILLESACEQVKLIREENRKKRENISYKPCENWKGRYLAVYYYISKYTIKKCLRKVAKRGYYDLINFFLFMTSDNSYENGIIKHYRIKGLIKNGDIESIIFYKSKGIKFSHYYLNYIACKYTDNKVLKYIEFPERKRRRIKEMFYEYGIFGAARNGNLNLLKEMENNLKKLSNDNEYDFEQLWDNTIFHAAVKNNMNIIEYIFSKDSCHYGNAINGAAQGGHIGLIEFFIKRHQTYGPKLAKWPYQSESEINWDYGMEGAAKGGHIDIINFFIQKGATDFQRALDATERISVINFLLKLIKV